MFVRVMGAVMVTVIMAWVATTLAERVWVTSRQSWNFFLRRNHWDPLDSSRGRQPYPGPSSKNTR